jgi:hypothetical protein
MPTLRSSNRQGSSILESLPIISSQTGPNTRSLSQAASQESSPAESQQYSDDNVDAQDHHIADGHQDDTNHQEQEREQEQEEQEEQEQAPVPAPTVPAPAF